VPATRGAMTNAGRTRRRSISTDGMSRALKRRQAAESQSMDVDDEVVKSESESSDSRSDETTPSLFQDQKFAQ